MQGTQQVSGAENRPVVVTYRKDSVGCDGSVKRDRLIDVIHEDQQFKLFKLRKER